MKVHSVAALAFSTPSQAQTAAACVDATSGLPINNGGSIVNNSVACGSGAATTAQGGIAVGYMPAFAGAFAPDSTAIGTNALTQGQDAIAIGTNATSNFANAITFGANTATTQANQVALGNNAVTSYVLGGLPAIAGTATDGFAVTTAKINDSAVTTAKDQRQRR